VAFKDYREFADDQIEFPVNGKTYRPAPLGVEAGLTLLGIFNGTDLSHNDEPAEYLWKLALGPVWDEMAADGAPLAAAIRAGQAALAFHTAGRAAAEMIWEAGTDPEALAAQMAAANPTQTDSTPSPSSDADDTTPAPASTSGTKSRPATPPARPKTPTRPRSGGKRSSSSGGSSKPTSSANTADSD
jgi:hypothetical protein